MTKFDICFYSKRQENGNKVILFCQPQVIFNTKCKKGLFDISFTYINGKYFFHGDLMFWLHCPQNDIVFQIMKGFLKTNWHLMS